MATQSNILELIQQQLPVALEAVRTAGAIEKQAAADTAESLRTSGQRLDVAAEDQALIVKTAQFAQLESQKKAEAAFTQTGADQALYNIITTMVAETPALTQDLDTLRQENIEASGLNIIGMLKQGLDWNGTQARVAGTVAKIQNLSEAAGAIEGRVGQLGNLYRSTTQTIAAGSAEAAARVAATEFKLKADGAYRESLRANAQQYAAVAATEDKILEQLVRARNLEMNEDRLDMERERMMYAREAAAEAKEAKLSEKEFDQRTMFYINLGRANRGMPELVGEEANQMLKTYKAKASVELEELHAAGVETANGGGARVAYSAAHTADLISRGRIGQLSDGREKALSLVQQAMMELDTARGSKTPQGIELADDPKGQKATEFINRRVRELVELQGTFIGNNLDNPRHIGDLGAYIGTPQNPGVSSFQKYQLVQKVFGPAAAAGISLTDPNKLFGLASAAVNNGDISMNQAAADMTNIFRRASELKVKELGYETMGIRARNLGSYVIEIDGQKLEATDYNAILRAMNSRRRQEMFREAGGKTFREGAAPNLHTTGVGLFRYGVDKLAGQVPRIPSAGKYYYTPENQAAGAKIAADELAARKGK